MTSSEDYLKDKIKEARKDLLVKKKPSNAIKSLLALSKNENFVNNNLYKNLLAMAYLENKNYSGAANTFLEIGETYQAGFCELLQGKIDTAADLWFNSTSESEACNWGKCLLYLINSDVNYLPSFMQIRNHLECDISYLIRANRLDYAENIIKCSDELVAVNPEAYKYIGKALTYSGYTNLAVNYFLKSQEMIPQDSEVYYYLAQYSISAKIYEEGKNLLKKALELNQHYVPAKNLLDKIEKKFLNGTK